MLQNLPPAAVLIARDASRHGDADNGLDVRGGDGAGEACVPHRRVQQAQGHGRGQVHLVRLLLGRRA